jgi:hypothetical protein
MKKFFATAILSLVLGPMAFAQSDLRLDITVHIQDYGDQRGTDGQWIGTKGQSKRLELINIKKLSGPDNVNIQYYCHIQDFGDTGWIPEGQDCGTRGRSLRLEGFAVLLTGDGAQNYKLSYQCHLQDRGDSGFFMSPEYCGTRG